MNAMSPMSALSANDCTHHITRLTGDDVELDEIEQLLIALQRSGHLSRAEMIQLQANFLRDVRS